MFLVAVIIIIITIIIIIIIVVVVVVVVVALTIAIVPWEGWIGYKDWCQRVTYASSLESQV